MPLVSISESLNFFQESSFVTNSNWFPIYLWHIFMNFESSNPPIWDQNHHAKSQINLNNMWHVFTNLKFFSPNFSCFQHGKRACPACLEDEGSFFRSCNLILVKLQLPKSFGSIMAVRHRLTRLTWSRNSTETQWGVQTIWV